MVWQHQMFFFIIIWRCQNIINGDQDCKHLVALSVNLHVLYILIRTLWYTSFVLRFQKEHNLWWHTTTYMPLKNIILVKWVYDDLQVLLKRHSGQMCIPRPTGALRKVNLIKWVYHNLLVPSNTQSGQMSTQRPTRTFKYSIESHEYITTYSFLQILNLVK